MDDDDAYLEKTNVSIDREKLLKLYMKAVNKLTDDCDQIAHITPEMLIGLISDVIEKHPKLLYKK